MTDERLALLKEARRRLRETDNINLDHRYVLGVAIGVLYAMGDEIRRESPPPRETCDCGACAICAAMPGREELERELSEQRAPKVINRYGNTVSSTMPEHDPTLEPAGPNASLERAAQFRDYNDGTGTVKMSRLDTVRLATLLDSIRLETIEACAKVAEIPVLRDEPHRIVRNIRNLTGMSAETVAKVAADPTPSAAPHHCLRPETWTAEETAKRSGLYDLARQETPDEAVRVAFMRGWARATDHHEAVQAATPSSGEADHFARVVDVLRDMFKHHALCADESEIRASGYGENTTAARVHRARGARDRLFAGRLDALIHSLPAGQFTSVSPQEPKT